MILKEVVTVSYCPMIADLGNKSQSFWWGWPFTGTKEYHGSKKVKETSSLVRK